MPVLFDKEGNSIEVNPSQMAQMLEHGLTKLPPGKKEESPAKIKTAKKDTPAPEKKNRKS